MKNSPITFLCLLTMVNYLQGSLCIGSLDYPSNVPSINPPHIYFEGYSIPVEFSTENGKSEASFEINTSGITAINFLFVDGALEACCQKKTAGIPTCLSIPNTVTYAYYTCLQQEAPPMKLDDDEINKPKKCMMRWQINKKDLTDRVVPKNTIIIMLAPSLIEKIESPTWDILNNFTPLARIIIKQDERTMHALLKKSTKIQFAALEMNAIHECQKVPQKINHNPDSLSITKGCLSLCQ